MSFLRRKAQHQILSFWSALKPGRGKNRWKQQKMGSRSLYILFAIVKCIKCLPAEAWLSITLLASVLIQSGDVGTQTHVVFVYRDSASFLH